MWKLRLATRFRRRRSFWKTRSESYRHSIAIAIDCLYPMAIKERDERMELLQGTLVILQTLQWGPQHGLGISQIIRRKSEELIRIEAGSLYPALHRLEQRGWLTSDWKTSEKNQRAKYYRLTFAGKRQLVSEQSKWKRLLRAIRLAMRPEKE